jgi:uncharacterized membrane protein (DUF373 family)
VTNITWSLSAVQGWAIHGYSVTGKAFPALALVDITVSTGGGNHSLSPAMDLFSDQRFLSAIHNYERQLAKILALLLAVVIGFATFELLLQSGLKVVQWQTDWFDGSLIKLLDRLLLIFIALEVLQNVTAYLRDHVVQIELVLLTALTAVARKVIVLPPASDDKAFLMGGFGLIVVGLATAYWLIRQAGQTRNPSLDTSSQPSEKSVAPIRQS